MALNVYNYLTRDKEPFNPITEGEVKMYVCGPTVYDHAHIGHGKTYTSMDVIVRYLRYSGYRVTYVQNITDVGHILDTGEDRILKGARRDRIEPMQVVETYMRSYLDDMDALKNTRPDIMPRAAAHVPEQIEATEKLIELGHAYEANGSVYFDVKSWENYGRLSGRKIEEQEESGRIETRTEKRNPEDFALWKAAPPEHILQWHSPWGRGYPGWHIECTAMATKYLGETFDIHGGGLENMFPHNECEMAQSEAMTGKNYSNYWLLTGSLTRDGVKMSKSLGNSLRIADLLKQYPAEVLRLFVLSAHYRGPIDISDDAIVAAQKGWERLVGPYNQAKQMLSAGAADSDDSGIDAIIADTKAKFIAEMDDDFNTPKAIAHLFDFVHKANTILNGDVPVAASTLEALVAMYDELVEGVLGLLPSGAGQGDETAAERQDGLIKLLIDLRAQARVNKDYATSDQIRDQLKELGVSLEDGKDGTKYRIAS